MIERVTSYRRIKKLVDWPLVVSSDVYYLIDTDNGKDLGLWSLEPCGEGLKIHADMGPKNKGKLAIQSAREAFRWVWNNTHAKFIKAEIPKYNKIASLVAIRAGMKDIGGNENLRQFQLMR